MTGTTERYTKLPRDFKRKLAAIGYRGNEILLLLEFYERYEAKRAALLKEGRRMESLAFAPRHVAHLFSEGTFEAIIRKVERDVLIRREHGGGRKMGKYDWNDAFFNGIEITEADDADENDGMPTTTARPGPHGDKNCSAGGQELPPSVSGNEEGFEKSDETPTHCPSTDMNDGIILGRPRQSAPAQTWNEFQIQRREELAKPSMQDRLPNPKEDYLASLDGPDW